MGQGWRFEQTVWILGQVPGFFHGTHTGDLVRVGFPREFPGQFNQAIVPESWLTAREVEE